MQGNPEGQPWKYLTDCPFADNSEIDTGGVDS
jgi:hypothetical protein